MENGRTDAFSHCGTLFVARLSFSRLLPGRSVRTLWPRQGRVPSVQRGEDIACWFKMAERAWKWPPSWAAGHRHHTGHRGQDPWNASDRLMNNTMVHCYEAGCLPGTCPCNYPQQNQLSGSHNSLGLIRGGFGTTCQGTVLKLFWHTLGELSVTRDETWAHPLETKEQWKQPGSFAFKSPDWWGRRCDGLHFLERRGSAADGLPERKSTVLSS